MAVRGEWRFEVIGGALVNGGALVIGGAMVCCAGGCVVGELRLIPAPTFFVH